MASQRTRPKRATTALQGRKKKPNLGRLELLRWVNEFIQSDYQIIDHLADGVAYMQVLDALYPGKVPLSKLNFNPNGMDECARNLRLLEDTMRKLGIPRAVPVNKLSKGQFQANYSFLQWCYQYVHKKKPEAHRAYQAYSRRMRAARAGKGNRKKKLASHLLPNQASFIVKDKQPSKARVRQQMREQATAMVANKPKPISSGSNPGSAQSLVHESFQPATASPKQAVRSTPADDVEPTIDLLGHGDQSYDDDPSGLPQPRQTGQSSALAGTSPSKSYDPGVYSGPVRPRNARAEAQLRLRTHSHLQYPHGKELEELIHALEVDLEARLADQRKLFEDVLQLREERDIYFNQLLSVEHLCSIYDDDDDDSSARAHSQRASAVQALQRSLRSSSSDLFYSPNMWGSAPNS